MDFEKYKNKKTYPKQVSYIFCHSCRKSTEKADAFCRSCGIRLSEYREKAKKQYREDQREYREEEAGLLEQFWADALDAVGLQDLPDDHVLGITVGSLKRIAWEEGRSSGLSEVFGNFEDLAGATLRIQHNEEQ